MNTISPGQIAFALQLASAAPAGQAVPLDPADPAQRALITAFLNASNKGPDRYPALHRAIAQAVPGGAAGAAETDATIIDLGASASGRATSRTWVASRGGAYISGISTLVLDAVSNQVLAAGTATQVGGTRVKAGTRPGGAQAAAPKMTALSFFHSQESPTAPPTFGLAATTRATLDPGLTITLSAPVQSKSTGDSIVIALCRDPGHQNGDADYIYPSSSNVDPDRLVVPFEGTASLPYPVDTTRSIALETKLYVNAANAWVYPLPSFNLSGPVTMSGYDVDWCYPYDDQPVNQTASIQYGMSLQANDTETDFFYQFTVPVQNLANPTYIFTVCSEGTPGEGSSNCFQIETLQYWWHCVAAGTLVTLANGSKVPVEAVDNTMRVRTGMGGDRAVVATSRAPHPGTVRRVVTEGGRTLVLSLRHPVATPFGPVAAADLAPGSVVLSENGPDRVASATDEPYDGLVYNLKLEQGAGYATYLAGGIAVGDHLAQAAYARQTRHDPSYMLPRLPQTHHQDYLSALADATAV
jgi:hypothetical protein